MQGSDVGGGRVRARPRLKRRAEFLHVAKGRRWHGASMTVQAAPREAEASDGRAGDDAARFGFTLTKKVGCAVVRNRVRRRLREVVRLAPPDLAAQQGYDYVLVGRVDALRLPFAAIAAELARGLAAVHRLGRSGRGRGGSGAGAGREAIAKPPGRVAPERMGPES